MVTSTFFGQFLDDAESFSEHFDHFNLVVGALRGRKKGKTN